MMFRSSGVFRDGLSNSELLSSKNPRWWPMAICLTYYNGP